MKFKNNNTFEPKMGASVDYLNSFGITEVDSFLYKPKPSDYENPWKLDYMQEMIDALHEGFENNKHFFLQVDSDVDGMTSSAIFYNYFTMLYPSADIAYRVHEGKEHGIILDTIPVITDIVVIPDAGSNQIDEQEIMSNEGRTVLVMDHHNVTRSADFNNVIIVNNQTSKNFKNKDLSGAGVVLKVIQAYDEKYGKRILYKRFEDLAALGIVSDCMDVRSLDNNAIIMNGFNNINNLLFKALIDQQMRNPGWIGKDGIPTKIDVAFYIAPLINAVIRSGTLEEKTHFFEGFINTNSEDIIQSISRGRLREETLYQYLARTAYNLRNRQNTRKTEALDNICKEIDAKGLNRNKVIIVKTDNLDIPLNITGLAAMEVVNIYKKPTLLLRPVKENGITYYRGSGRGTKSEGFYNFQEVLLKSGLMHYCEGHDMAFGASIEERNIDDLIKYLNTTLSNVDFVDENEVDCCLGESNWSPLVLKEFGEMLHVFGQGLPQPKFYFKAQVRPSDFKIQGEKQNALKLLYKGVSLIALNRRDLVEQFLAIEQEAIINKKKIEVEVIGTSEINEYMGYKNIQIKVKQMEMKITETKSSLF